MLTFLLLLQPTPQPQWNPRSVEIPSRSSIAIEDSHRSCSTGVRHNAQADALPCNVDEWRDEVTGQYPYDALFKGHEGAVRIKGVVRPSGRFSECAVIKSSGNNALDQKACRSMTEYAQFQPARNTDGEAIFAMFETTVTYRLPEWPEEGQGLSRVAEPINIDRWLKHIQENYPSHRYQTDVTGPVGLRVLVAPNGRAVYCEVTKSSGRSVPDKAACRGMLRYSRFNPALDTEGKATIGTYETQISYWFSKD